MSSDMKAQVGAEMASPLFRPQRIWGFGFKNQFIFPKTRVLRLGSYRPKF